MSSSRTGGNHQDERGKNCVDEDPNTKCISLPLGDDVVAKPRDTYPWIALNLGGIQQQTEQFVDVSRVEVTIGEKTNANFAVFVSKLSPGRLSRCLKEGTFTCIWKLNPVCCKYVERWLNGPSIILMGEENGPFDDEDTFSISEETSSGGIICWEGMSSQVAVAV